jgi:hypothetical protein
MVERRLQRQGVIGNCTATLFKLRDCFDVVAELLQDGGFGFPPCSTCGIRPRVIDQTVDSDWDEVTGTLKPNSVAWAYS